MVMENVFETLRSVDDETSGPDEDGIAEVLQVSEETGAPVLPAYFKRFQNVDSDLVDRQIALIQKMRGNKILPSDIKALASYAAAKHASAVAQAAPRRKLLDFGFRRTTPGGLPMSPSMSRFRSDIIDAFAARVGRGNMLREDDGYYFSTLPIEFDCSGTGANSVAYLAAGATVDCFTEAIGAATTRLGNPTVVSSIDTNLSYPGQNTYVDQLFIIEAISARFRGMRVKYDPASYAALGFTAPQTAIVNGTAVTWDDAGIYLPVEMFQDFSTDALLAKVVASSSTLSFRWRETGVGDNATEKSTFVDTFERLPNVARSLTQSSGGAAMFDTQKGYIWTLNQNYQLAEQGGNGIFKTRLTVNDEIVYPFSSVQLPGAAAAAMPLQLGLYWEIRLHGTSLRAKSANKMDRRVL